MNNWLPRHALIWQLVAVWIAVAPHLPWMPFWLSGLLLGATLARIQIYRGVWSFPHWGIKGGLILILVGGLVLTFSRSSLMSGTLALLIGGLALKMVEIHTRRDAFVLIFLSFFVIATHFLFEQGILTALFALVGVTAVLASQIALFDLDTKMPFKSPLRTSLKILLPSLPLMVLLFLLIPRIGPLWTVPLDQSQAKTGLASEVSPGDISQLTRSGQLAFRARFDSAVPPPAQRYWRTLVYSDFDGRVWSIGSRVSGHTELEPIFESGQTLNYEVIMEPSFRPWLVALDVPQSVQGAELSAARQVHLKQPADKRVQYRVSSSLSYQLGETLTTREFDRYTAFPENVNPETQALAQRFWLEADQDLERFVQLVMQNFTQRFTYTLEPPLLGSDSVDQFLFDTQRGFCSHFASATALMLRSVGVPARMVGGYLGGELNPEGYITVRQYDAHAWVEYFSENRGWVRLDPTSAVSPDRVEQTAESLFADQPGFMGDQPFSPLRFSQSGWMFQLRQQIDALNFSWHRWVLNYQTQQSSLLSDLLGGLTPLRLALGLLIPGALIMAFVHLQLKPKRLKLTPLERSLQRFNRALLRQGIKRKPRQPIFLLASELALVWPDWRAEFDQLATTDELRRYAQDQIEEPELLAAIDSVTKRLDSLPKREIDRR